MRGNTRGARELRKSRDGRVAGKKILIVTEGIRTEPFYFDKLAKYLNSRAVRVISVKPVGLGKDPLSVVMEAVARRSRERLTGDPFDATWCVVDVDDHHSLEDACTLARKEGISLAISSPCFEIWLIWHFANHSSWVSSAGTFAILKARHGFSGKAIPEDFPYSNYVDAIIRSSRCEDVTVQHRPPNPHSSVAQLAEELRDSSMRRK
ncbi:RloB family protein [Kitasatospora griseola]|uniref:RloB family protein n=1 Tax=Kitasatospora griseola TaxID=2064 RepID=UPI0036D78A41